MRIADLGSRVEQLVDGDGVVHGVREGGGRWQGVLWALTERDQREYSALAAGELTAAQYGVPSLRLVTI